MNLARIEHHVEAQDEPYEKLDHVMSTTSLDALRSTFCPMERRAMLDAASNILSFHREKAPVVAEAYGLPYPAELEGLTCERFDELARNAG